MVGVSDDLGNDGGSRRQTMAGDDMGDDAGNDVGDGDDGGDNAGNNAGKGDGGDAGEEGGGGSWRRTRWRRRRQRQRQRWRRRLHIAGVVAFYCEDIFFCGIFIMCGGSWRGHTSPHTLVTLEVCRRTFGWGRKSSSKIVVCKYQKLASKKAWQPKLVVFYTKVLGTKH